MVDEADLENNLLEFAHKSFAYARSARVGAEDLAVFERTETESESQFRPRLVKLRVVVPQTWLMLDLASEMLLISRDGKTPSSRSSGSAKETAAESTEFREQGVDWKRIALRDGSMLYAPQDHVAQFTSPLGLEALGLS